jgi:CRISPR-associated protein Csm5
MKQFLTPVRLVLTPLSPIHIGLGEDFDPTSYIIEKNVLYVFDPAKAELSPDLRKELLSLTETVTLDSMRKVYTFFKRQADFFMPHAHALIPVAEGIAQKYEDSIGKNVQIESGGSKVINNNFIERAVFLTGDGRPYLPGGSVKGAMRTAWLEALQKTKAPNARIQPHEVNKFEKEMFADDSKDFSATPLRLLKIADFMPQGDIDRKIVFALNMKKKTAVVNGRTAEFGKGPSARKEAILSGQYRAFISETALFEPGHPSTGTTPQLRPDIVKLARDCNVYYRPRFNHEWKLLRKRGLVSTNWLDRLQDLLDALLPVGQKSDAIFLIRLGRYGGAESKTLSALAKIKISPSRSDKESTTLWLATDKESQTKNLLPFGWALVEVNPQGENELLRRWCEEERKDRPDMKPVREALRAKKIAIAEKQAKLREEAAAYRAEELKKAEENAHMSVEQRELAAFCARLTNHPPLKPCDAGHALINDCVKILTDACAWPPDNKKAVAEQLEPLIRTKNICLGKKAKQINQLLNSLRG